ncbi:hypothetical protein FEM48_Zijuj12G0065700 [Ziziphus jujuba var. spinosa]|uniref:Trichome birefringence-like N-terminal domain-containing protein n=1 Tax=Ziziphus jujuba var. spinosa TaxID=714518 RepID=A0A978UBR0_ZIZJJ|nr:hypothetical protein FEM48_Zijuj12G0065700 [Ziziphus jujuba var. spinosa]
MPLEELELELVAAGITLEHRRDGVQSEAAATGGSLLKELRLILTFLILLIFTFVISSLVSPFDPQFIFRFGLLSQLLPNKSNNNNNNNNTSSVGACDYSYGRWVPDESYTLESYTENCPFLDPGFRCTQNGRKDDGYRRWRWQPAGCDLPRFNASDLLERSKNGRIVFAGDSIGRNQWESFLCMLAQGVSNKSSIYEVNGKPINKHKGFLSMRFNEYNLTVEYYRAPFLVNIGRPPQNSSKQVRSTVKVDQLHWGCYFEEDNEVNITMDVVEAFRRSLQTWKSWALENLDPQRTHVFFRSYSPVHYRNGTWNEGGWCDSNVGPETNYTNLESDPFQNLVIYNAIKQMDYGNWNVQYLNITYLTEFRKDGHPSKYREPGTPPSAPQDCSHWCLPGVPDTWNNLLYAYLLSKEFRTK